jgi:hypothetical protein
LYFISFLQAARLRLSALLLLAPSSTPASASTLARTFANRAPDYLYDAGGASHTLGTVIPTELGKQLGWDAFGWDGTRVTRLVVEPRRSDKGKREREAGGEEGEDGTKGGFAFVREARREAERRRGKLGEGGMYL